MRTFTGMEAVYTLYDDGPRRAGGVGSISDILQPAQHHGDAADGKRCDMKLNHRKGASFETDRSEELVPLIFGIAQEYGG